MDGFWAELMRMPLWAQVGVGWFALTAVFMVFGPVVGKMRYRRRFDALVRELGLEVSKDSDWPFTVALTVEGRAFEIRYDFGGGKDYRGPRGHLLITETPLAEPKWSMHHVDIEKSDSGLTWLGGGKRSSGDPAFDARFSVISEGANVRDDWLDATTRAGVAQFLDLAPREGLIRVKDGRVSYTMSSPWKGLDAASLRTLLQRQAAFASVLERTARGML